MAQVNRVAKFWNRQHRSMTEDVTDTLNDAYRLIEDLEDKLRTVAADEAKLWRESWAKREAAIRARYETIDWVRVGIGAVAGFCLGWLLKGWL